MQERTVTGRRLRRAGTALAAAAALALGGAATAVAVVNGTPDAGAHPYVGLVGDHATGELCSGSLVSPTVFVTAAHCVGEGDPVVLDFQDDGFADLTGPGVGVVTGVAHPDPAWTSGNGVANGDRNDLAVVVLDEPVSLPRYAQLPAQGLDDTLPRNQAVQIVGYGVTDPADPSTFGTRRSALSRIVPGGGALGAEFLKLAAGHGVGAICNGDSGGPELLPGTDTVLAIGSFGPSANCKAVGYAQRLDSAHALAFVGAFLG